MDVPLVVFVNTRSGGQQGAKILEKFKKCVPLENIFDLSKHGPALGLQKYKGSRFRIIVCGGDGTVGWVLGEIEKLKLPREITPPVAILPLGTGNDLSRILKWGGSFNGKKLKSVIGRVDKACVVLLDKWKISYEGHGDQPLPHAHHLMNNYFSVGADADIALQFHEMRLAHPERFKTRVHNKAWYMRLGLQNILPELLPPHVTVEVDGHKVELPDHAKCVVVLNLPSYAGGGNPWGTLKDASRRKHNFVNPAVDDGLLEVVALNGPLQLAGIHANIIRGKRLGQGNNIKITLNKMISAQVDGEPWRQPSSTITIQHAGKSFMLANSLPTLPTHPTLLLSADAADAPLPPAMAREVSYDSAISSATARVIMRTRSVSNPVENTPSPIKYGPIQPSKRKKGRLYCDKCGLEFYLPYMRDNHLKSGLCNVSMPPSNDSSADVKEPPRTISMQVDDGATSLEERTVDSAWRSRSAESPAPHEPRYEMEDDEDEHEALKANGERSPSKHEKLTEPKSQPEAQQAHMGSQRYSSAAYRRLTRENESASEIVSEDCHGIRMPV